MKAGYKQNNRASYLIKKVPIKTTSSPVHLYPNNHAKQLAPLR